MEEDEYMRFELLGNVEINRWSRSCWIELSVHADNEPLGER